jgi:Photosynthesis system II assembly factor YCF48
VPACLVPAPTRLLVLMALAACGDANPSNMAADDGGGSTSTTTAIVTGSDEASGDTVAASSGIATLASDEGTSSQGSESGGSHVGDDCDDLPPGRVGVWEDITPPELAQPDNMEAATIAIDPIDCSVYATAGNKTNGGDGGTGVFKSSDAGATWSKISTGENGAKLETGVIWSLRIDPEQPQRMYLASGYGNDPTIYRSVDGGVDWEMLNADPEDAVNDFAQAIGMDRADPMHLVITWHDTCVAPHTPLCLSETRDGGDSWTIVDGPPELPGWAEGASITIVAADSLLLAADSGAWFSSDDGGSWAKVIEGVHYGSYGGGAHFGPDGAAYLGMANQGVFVSRADGDELLGASWSLIPGSPQAAVLVDDGTRLYATYLHDTGGQPFYSAPLDDLSTWTNMPSPSIGRGSVMLAYDPTRKLIYSANLAAGLWRLRTQ